MDSGHFVRIRLYPFCWDCVTNEDKPAGNPISHFSLSTFRSDFRAASRAALKLWSCSSSVRPQMMLLSAIVSKVDIAHNNDVGLVFTQWFLSFSGVRPPLLPLLPGEWLHTQGVINATTYTVCYPYTLNYVPWVFQGVLCVTCSKEHPILPAWETEESYRPVCSLSFTSKIPEKLQSHIQNTGHIKCLLASI